jgi:uncharacterized protein (DUF885 family)
MMRFYHFALLGIGAWCLTACGKHVPPPALQTVPVEAPQQLLTRIVEGYWDETAARSPWYSWGGAEMRYGEAPADILSPQAQADSLAIERRYLAEVLLVPRAPLSSESKLTYDIFWRERKLAIESFTYPSELLPVNAYEGVPQRFALMASAAERYALSSPKDFDNWQLRADYFGRWTDQAIANMREGMRRGYTLPRVVVQKTLPLLAALGEDSPANVFYQALDSGTDDAERARLRLVLSAAVRDKILPAYRRLHDFLQNDYLPRSRDSVGLWALPLGDAWYAYLSRRATNSVATPAQLHAVGLTEVDHLRGRLESLLAEAGFAGNGPGFVDSLRHDPRYSFRSAEELLGAYQALKTQVAAAAPNLFPTPRADVDIRAVEVFRQATSPASFYQRALAYGKNPAVFYVNTADLDAHPAIAVTAQYLREAVPGHHYQIALQQERSDLPRFRRFGGAPGFIAGWGLYAASLGEELGLYHDPQAKFGALLAQLECAADVVIDTGIHSQKWTRQQAIDYVHAQVPMDDSAAERVDRDIALPGEALACSGFLKIQALRSRSQQTLGARFDLAAFHAAILNNGAVPLDLLDATINQWMQASMAVPEKVD